MQKSCAFTGHRPDKFSFGFDESHPDCIRLRKAIDQSVARLVQAGITTFYTGMALGVDLWAARAVLALREENPALRLVAVQPCATQADRWGEKERETYRSILSQADERICLHESYTRFCMHERNRYMVDRAQYLLAIYDGGESGGTASTVRYAESRRRNIWLLDPDSLQLVQLVPPQMSLFESNNTE